MWSDNDIDKAFQRLNPPEPEPAPFPLDAWLRLENQLDKAAVERTVRRRLWRFFAAEVAVVLLVVVGWLAWPTAATTATGTAPAAEHGTRVPAEPAAASARLTAKAVAPAAVAATRTRATTAAGAMPVPAAVVETVTASSSPQPAAAANLPVAKPGATRLAPGSRMLAAAAPGTQQHAAEAKISLGALAAQPNSPSQTKPKNRLNKWHLPNDTRPGLAAAHLPIPAARLAAGQAAAAAHRSAWHPAAGSIAATPEAPTPAAVAAAARLRHHRKGQPPLPTVQPTATATREAPAPATALHSFTDSYASNTSVGLAALPSIPARLLLPAPVALPGAVAPTAAAAPLTQPVRQPRFYVALVAAPDVSTVRFAGVEKPRPNVGVVLEYRLTNRLRVNTGLLRATKMYMARRDDYDWGAYSKLVYARNFTDVEGTCTVLDVPLNLRYDLVARPHYRLFGGVGVSSFFMQREQYYYDWTDYNGTHTWNGYAVNQSQNLLSILNVSVGYERSLGAHWSMQAEPYAKLPLAGVGLGKVRLTSAGVFFGLKYGF